MKKQFILVSALAVCAIAALCVTSCKKDEESKTTCFCRAYEPSTGMSDSDTVSLSEFGASDCNDLARKLSAQSYGISFSCE